MNVMAKTMWRTMAEMVDERGGTAECISGADGFRVQVYGGKRPFVFVVDYDGLEKQGYREVLGKFRDLVRMGLGSTALELRLEREEAQAELGKQKTPFRPGRRRVRLRVKPRGDGYRLGLLDAARHVEGALGPWSNVPVQSIPGWLRSKVTR